MANDLVFLGNRPAFLPAVGSPPVPTSLLAGISGSGGLAIPQLSFRGKVWRIRKDGEEVLLADAMDDGPMRLLILSARSDVSKRYYDKGYVPGVISLPRCWADDGKHPQGGEHDPIAPTCSECPLNAWGSAVRNDGSASRGKACSDFKRLIVYPLVLGRGDIRLVQACVLAGLLLFAAQGDGWA